jgi:tripeptidyl-peptidase-1
LTAAEVGELIAPTNESLRLVETWLESHGIFDLDYSPTRDWISLHTTVSKAERLLATTYHTYHHVDGDVAIRAPEWSLPAHLHEHIDAIHPTNAFFRPSLQPRAAPVERRGFEAAPLGLGVDGLPSYEELAAIDKKEMGHMDVPSLSDFARPEAITVDEACNKLATSPLCLRTLYATLNYTPQVPNKTSVALVNYLGQVNNRSDIAIFLQRYRPDAFSGAADFRTEIVSGGTDQQTPVTPEQVEAARTIIALEGNLNAETILGLAHPIPLKAYNVGGKPPFQSTAFTTANKNEPYLEWASHMLSKSDDELPRVISTSYADEEQSVPLWYARRACAGFAALGARGVSLLFASGDEGVGQDDKCFAHDDQKKKKFLPVFPASCPYVTTVGGTRHWAPEMAGFDARSGFVTGGGFSNYFPQPKYQRHDVQKYITSLNGMYDGLYNKTGRGYPDISLRAYHFITVWNGTAHILDGTSASSPAAAGIFALVNDALAAQGKPPLGWLNPWIYAGGYRGFKDVTVGSNPGCNTAGFPATKGWDASTGFGTPVCHPPFQTAPIVM